MKSKKKKQLVWFGHVKKMDEEQIPKKALEWTPSPERRKRGRPRRSWVDEANEAMRSKNLKIVDVWDRVTWKRRSAARRRNPKEEEEEEKSNYI